VILFKGTRKVGNTTIQHIGLVLRRTWSLWYAGKGEGIIFVHLYRSYKTSSACNKQWYRVAL